MSPPANIPTFLVEALAVREAFRKLNFTEDEIYLRPQRDRLYVSVRRHGKEFHFDVGEHRLDIPELVRLLREADDWFDADDTHRVAAYEASEVRKNIPSLMTALKRKGFVVFPPRRVMS